ncbi:MAG: hypothetical protein ACOC1U_09400 [Spirochaetota bacterium]
MRVLDWSAVFPREATNTYRGRRIALWFFVLFTVVSVIRALVHMAAPDGGAQSIATIPLDDFTTNGAAATVHLFALWGLSQFIVGLLSALALVRYRSLIPLFYLLAIVEYAARLVFTGVKPIEIAGTAPGAVGNYVLVPLLLVMFLLSIAPPNTTATNAPTAGGTANTRKSAENPRYSST